MSASETTVQPAGSDASVIPPPALPALGIIRGEPADRYHATKAVSFHRLMDFDWRAGGSPALYHWKHIQGNQGDETKAMRDGRAVHVLVLEGEAAFRERYRVLEPGVNFATKEGKELKRQAAELGDRREMIKADDHELYQRMRTSVHANPFCREMLGHGEPEVTVRVQGTGNLVKQVRFDWLDLQNQRGADFKSFGDSLEKFHYEVEKRHYDRQLPFYSRVLAEAVYNDRDPHQDVVVDLARQMVLIATEKEPMWRTQPFLLDEPSIRQADDLNRMAYVELLSCMERDIWPDGTSGRPVTITTRRAASPLP